MVAALLLTSLSLSFPGMDQRFHHDNSLSHFQERPSSPLPTPAPVAVILWYLFSQEFMAAMQEVIRAEVHKFVYWSSSSRFDSSSSCCGLGIFSTIMAEDVTPLPLPMPPPPMPPLYITGEFQSRRRGVVEVLRSTEPSRTLSGSGKWLMGGRGKSPLGHDQPWNN